MDARAALQQLLERRVAQIIGKNSSEIVRRVGEHQQVRRRGNELFERQAPTRAQTRLAREVAITGRRQCRIQQTVRA